MVTDADFAPYRATNSGRSVDEIFDQVNRAVWLGYGPDYSAGGHNKVVAGPLFDFVALLRALTARPDARFVTHRELITEPGDPDEVRIAIRHDIDSDIVAAVWQARIEQEFGIPATWLVLHTAAYYGHVDRLGRFQRHESMASVYRELQDHGHEVALHTDPLGLYQRHGVRGSEGVIEELRWLRSHGLDITGATAHNNRPVYGAENYEVFTGWVSPGANAHPGDVTHVVHGSASAPLRVLDESALGLVYEGNQVFWNHPRRVVYGATRFAQLWNLRPHRRHVRRSGALDLDFADQDRVIHEVLSAAVGSDVVLVIHPEYYGVRSHDGPPEMRVDLTSRATSPLGSEAWAPGVVAVSQPEDAGGDTRNSSLQVSQAINVANEWGMLDLPVQGRAGAERTIVVAGGHQIDAAHLPIQVHASTRVASLAAKHLDGGAAVFKVASRGASLGEVVTLIERALEEVVADTVVLAVGRELYDTSFGPDLANESDWLDEIEAFIWWLDRRGIDCILLLDDPADADTLEDLRFADRLAGLASTLGRRFIAPQQKQREESRRLGAAQFERGRWNVTEHRVASEHLYRALFASALEPADAAPAHDGPDDQRPPDPSGHERQRQARAALGILEFPVPFAGAIALVSDIDGSLTHRYHTYMGELVDRLGLDHGDSIHLAGYHQRHTEIRPNRPAIHRSIFTHDLRRENRPLAGSGSWSAHVAREFHRGNIDHFHGLWSWGARTVPLDRSPRSSGEVVLTAPNGTEAPAPGTEPAVRFSMRAAGFPLVAVAVETTAASLPDTIVFRERTEPLDRSIRSRLRARFGRQVSDEDDSGRTVRGSSIELHLRRVQATTSGTRIATWALPRRAMALVDPPNIDLHATWDQHEIAVALDPGSVVSAALHNTDMAGLDWSLRELRRRSHIALDLITTHGRYHFSTTWSARSLMKYLAKQRRDAGDSPVAHYGHPSWVGLAASAVADDPDSPAWVDHALRDFGLRHVTPGGLIMESEATFTVDDATFSARDRSGDPVRFLRRTRPACADGSTGDHSRLSTVETRLRTVLNQLDDGEAGVWPIYTHLGQTSDIGFDPDVWFGDGVVDELAQRYFGGTAEGLQRPWLTRASVLANYTAAMQSLADRCARSGDEIAVTLPGASADDHAFELRSLFGVSVAVDDPLAASFVVYSNDDAAARTSLPLVRWLDRSAVTAVPCGIEWPLIGADDPVWLTAMAANEHIVRDLGPVTIEGEWTWDEQSGGTLLCSDEGAASITMGLDAMDAAGAQVILGSIRPDSEVAVSVVCRTAGGATMVASGEPAPPAPGKGWFELRPTAGEWQEIAIPLWGMSWSGPVPDHRAIVEVRVEVAGSPGKRVQIADLRLGRPRATLGRGANTNPRIGGDASGHALVTAKRLTASGAEASLDISVDADGFFATPPLPPGTWLLTAGDEKRMVVLNGDRFDVDLNPQSSGAKSKRSNQASSSA